MLCHSFSSLKLFLDGRLYFLDKTSISLLIGMFFFSPDFSIIMFSVCETIKPMSNGFWVTYGLNHHEQEMIYVEKERLIPWQPYTICLFKADLIDLFSGFTKNH